MSIYVFRRNDGEYLVDFDATGVPITTDEVNAAAWLRIEDPEWDGYDIPAREAGFVAVDLEEASWIRIYGAEDLKKRARRIGAHHIHLTRGSDRALVAHCSIDGSWVRGHRQNDPELTEQEVDALLHSGYVDARLLISGANFLR